MMILIVILLLILAITFLKTKLKTKSIDVTKRKLFGILGIVAVLVIVSIFLITFINEHKYDNIEIKENYYAVLSGGVGELVNETYLYIDNGKYKYIQVSSHTTEWGSTEWIAKVTKVGKLTWPQQVIDIAKENGSDSLVRLNVDIPETTHQKGYKKGDLITIDELRLLISIK